MPLQHKFGTMHIILSLCHCKLQLSSERNGWWLMNVTEISFVRQQEEIGPELCVAWQSARCCQHNRRFIISSNDWKPMKKHCILVSHHTVYASWAWGRFLTLQSHHHPAGYCLILDRWDHHSTSWQCKICPPNQRIFRRYTRNKSYLSTVLPQRTQTS